MFNVKRNFSSIYKNDMNCILCQTEIEDQQHLIFCENLNQDEDTILEGNYNDIFGNDANKIHKIMKILKKKVQRREKILSEIV